jgi:tRNA(Ile)-lysidine synthase
MRVKPKIVPQVKRPASNAALESASPLGAQEFAKLMDALAPLPRKIALAVSGGPDSMALALCVKRWLKPPHEAVALVVDHGLRAESAKEAEHVRGALKRLGFETEILCWRHDPVTARLHEAARKARYDLLTEACRARGIDALLLAHQREDQAETILMRFAKGSGVDGLAGMRLQSVKNGLRLLRVLLDVPRVRLVATCAAAKVPFISDPSNASEKFARGRLRRVMPLLAAEGFTIERLLDLGPRASEAKDALDHYAEALLRVAGKMDEAGALRLDLEHLRAAPKAVRERAFGACLHSVGGGDYAPERIALAALLAALGADKEMASRTLNGCLIGKTMRTATIMREFAAITDFQPIAPGESVIWDHRWRVTLDKKAESGFAIRPLGNPPHDILDRLAPELRKIIPQGRARACLPSLWRKGKLALMPALSCTRYKSTAKAEFSPLWPPRLNRMRKAW